jgi:autotransporter-associated beta strand protein
MGTTFVGWQQDNAGLSGGGCGGTRRRVKPLFLFLLAWCALSGLTAPAQAKERHWIGGSSKFWGDGNNWYVPGELQGGVPPQNGDDLVFDTGEPDEDVDTSPMFNELPNLTVGSITFRGDNDGWTINGNTFTVTNKIRTADDSSDLTIRINPHIKLGGDVQISANENWDTKSPINDHQFEIDLNGPIDLGGHALTVYAGNATLIHVSGVIEGNGAVVAKGTGEPDPDKLGKVVFDGAQGNTFHGTMFVKAGWRFDGQWYTSTVHFNKQSGVVVNDHLRISDMAIVTLDRPEQIGDQGTVEIDGFAARQARGDSDISGSSGVTVGGTPQVSAGIDLNGHSETIGNLTIYNFASDVLPAFVLARGGGVLSVLSNIISIAEGNGAVPVIKGQLSLMGAPNAPNNPLNYLQIAITNLTGYSGLEIEASVLGAASNVVYVSGNCAMTLSGNNPYAGFWGLFGATLDVPNSPALNKAARLYLGNGASLILRDASITGPTLEAAGFSPITVDTTAGTLVRAVGNCAWNGPIELDRDLVVFADNMALSGPISGEGGIEFLSDHAIVGGSAPNTFTGRTLAHCALLEFNKPSQVNAFAGPLFVGGGGNPSEARWLNSFQQGVSNLTVFANGLVNLNGHNEEFDQVVFNSGRIQTGAGELQFHRLEVNSSSTTAVIEGSINLAPPNDVEFHVAHGTAVPDLYINGTIVGGTPHLIKTGPGTMRFGQANNYVGVTEVREGVLQIDNPGSLGATSGNTVISSNATLRVGFAGTIPEPLSIFGQGVGGTQGPLQVISGGSVNLTGFLHLDGPSTVFVGPQAALNINASIGGTGPLTKIGPGNLILAGAQANTYSGDTLVTEGTLSLNKSTGISAIPGHLIIDTPAAVVRHFSSDNINGSVTVDHAALWDLNDQHESFSIGALEGHPPLTLKNGGLVQTGAGIVNIPVGGDIVVAPGFAHGSTISGRIGLDPGPHHFNVSGHLLSSVHGTECTVTGDILETSPGASLEKDGGGTLRLVGANSYTGPTVVAGGTLWVDGTQTQSPVQVNGGAMLFGSGTVGTIDFAGTAGVVQAGTGPGILGCGNFSANATGNGTLTVQLNGPDAGSGYDQLNVHGTVNLSGITLSPSLNFVPLDTNQFVLIKNDGADPVIGTFNGLAQDAILDLGGEQFAVSYTGGDGNDVVLRHLSALAVPASVWTNTVGGDWNNPANWSPNVVPNASNATITNNGSYSISNNVDAAVARLFYGNPNCTLTGSGNFNLSSLFSWQGGSFDGSGTVTAQGGMHISSLGPKFLKTKTLSNTGAATWSDDGTIYFSGGAMLSNATNATFDCAGDGTLENLPGSNLIVNAGLLRKTAGTGTTRINVPFINTGNIVVRTGTLSLNNGGTNFGTITVPSGGTFALGGGTHTLTSGSTLTGAGNFLTTANATVVLAGLVDLAGPHSFNGGTLVFAGNYNCFNDLTISGSTVSFNGTGTISPSSLTLGSFGMLGGSNLVTVNGPMTWGSSSTISGASNLVINGELTIPPGTVFLSGRTLINTTAASWSNNVVGAIELVDNAVLSNAPNATFDCIGEGIIENSTGSNVFANLGLFRKIGAASTTRVDVAFNNSADVQVQSGLLSLAGGGTTIGECTVTAGARFDLTSGTHNFSPASSITGAGDFSVSGGTANLAGLVNVGGIHTFSFGTANIIGNYSCVGNALVISGGTANFNGTGTIAPATLDLSGFGNLGGSNLVTVSGLMNWGGSSSISGSNNLIAAGGLNISGGVVLSGRTLVNLGTTIWSNNVVNSLTLSDGAVLSNAPGATFDCAIDNFIWSSAGSNQIINAGLFRKIGGSNTTFISVPFHNLGVVEAQSGRLNFAGPFSVEAGGVIRLRGGEVTNTFPIQVRGGVLGGNGQISGAVVNHGLVSPGASPGQLSIASDYTQAADGSLMIEIGGTNAGVDFDRLMISNSATLDGTLTVTLTNDFYPAANSRFTFLTSSNRIGTFASFNYPSNDITLALDYGPQNVALKVLNTRPSIAPIADHIATNHSPFEFAVNASDSDLPAQSLSYGLLLSPPGAKIDAHGVISWTPDLERVPATTSFTVLVADSGSPTLVATRTFRVTVGEAGASSVRSIQIGDPGAVSNVLTFAGIPNSTYIAQYATNLPGVWFNLSTNVADANGLWQIIDPSPTNSARFYRSQWLPGP